MTTPSNPAPGQPPKLLTQVAELLRVLHYSRRTEKAYVDWAKRFILFHHKRHPREMGAAEIEAYLTHLAVAGKIAASTQNQALAAPAVPLSKGAANPTAAAQCPPRPAAGTPAGGPLGGRSENAA